MINMYFFFTKYFPMQNKHDYILIYIQRNSTSFDL